jgi:putative DNA primase/helicase
MVQSFLLTMRRHEVAVILGHHSAKGGQQRGTSRRADILDVVLKLSPSPDQIADGRTRILVEYEKARSIADRNAFTAILEPHPTTGLMWTRADSGLPVNDRIRAMLIDGMPPSEIAAELKTARSFVYRVRSEMLESGELQDGRRSRGQSVSRASVVPCIPSLKRGQGTYAANSAGDK